MCFCLCVRLCVQIHLKARRGRWIAGAGVPGSWSYLMQVLVTELTSSVGAAHTLNDEAISPAALS